MPMIDADGLGNIAHGLDAITGQDPDVEAGLVEFLYHRNGIGAQTLFKTLPSIEDSAVNI